MCRVVVRPKQKLNCALIRQDLSSAPVPFGPEVLHGMTTAYAMALAVDLSGVNRRIKTHRNYRTTP